MTSVQELVYDPCDPLTLRDPHPLFKRMRREHPVQWSAPMAGWIVTRYDLTSAVLSDSATYSAERLAAVRKHLPAEGQATAIEILRWLSHWMVFRDAPDHLRLRRHMAGVFSMPTFKSLEANVSDVTTYLLDRLPRGDAIDFVRDFAIMLPGMVIMDFFGIPRDRLLEVKQWSDDMMLFIGSARGVADKYQRAQRGAFAMAGLFQELIAERRKSPADDILSKLIASRVNGEPMNDDELIGSMMMVLNGGHETTANLISNTILALLANPDQLALVRERPETIASTIEEVLRYDGPILSVGRVVVSETQLGDRTLSPGERVFTMLVAANRDPEVFAEPDSFDVSRERNFHMAFGKGPHFCLGAALARMEGQIALRQILQRFDSITLEEPTQSIPWINSLVTRGPTRLPLRLS